MLRIKQRQTDGKWEKTANGLDGIKDYVLIKRFIII